MALNSFIIRRMTMTTYITNITSDKLNALLIGLKKEDTLIIFHSADEQQIPIDMISLFANAKGTVKFEEMPDELGLAFEIGRLYAETTGKPRATLEIQGDAPIFDRLGEFINGKKTSPAPKKPQKAAKAEINTAADKPEIKKDPEKEENKKPAAKAESKKASAGKEKTNDEASFDVAFEKFTNLIESMKTDKYDPSGCKHGVLLAVRAINEDPSLTFEKVLPTTTTAANSRKFLANISAKNIDKLIASAREVLKYDN
jgi:hypothetical protein